MILKGKYTFIATPQQNVDPKKGPTKMEYGTLVVEDDHVMITNRCGVQMRLDMNAAQALGLVLRDTVLS